MLLQKFSFFNLVLNAQDNISNLESVTRSESQFEINKAETNLFSKFFIIKANKSRSQ